MQKLSVANIIQNIQNKVCFSAVADDYSFTIKIKDYVPYVCAAIHDGHQFRTELWAYCMHTQYERWYEEDPCTKAIVKSHPIVLAGCDSRFEYDLNREPHLAIYEDAWGKKLWKTPLPDELKQKSLNKHQNFYSVVHALIHTLEDIHGKAIVYDIHSYNWKRWERPVPEINLGTQNIDQKRYKASIESWQKMLAGLNIPYIKKTTANINDTFKGNGYFLKYITQNFKNTLVLATEFKKIYCDEHQQIIFVEVVKAIEVQLKKIIRKHAQEYSHNN